MRILIKLGGTLLDSDDSRRRLAREIAALCRAHSVVAVHGGGKQMTRFLSERGVESRFVEGLRVTTPEVLDAVLKVLAGTVNKQLVSALIEA
ncbi:MAG: acetylglutamate kinase, partial [Bryobacteraceae bacterium]|nr:acetylglutamate kinase [Bryobacteraceae bacterium]